MLRGHSQRPARPPPTSTGSPRRLTITQVQLGDFVPALQNATHWVRPFACGGAGTVLSRAAVVQTDFASCARRFDRSCLQSDWMISYCLGPSVLPLTRFGCSAAWSNCGRLGGATSGHQRLMRPHIRRRL